MCLESWCDAWIQSQRMLFGKKLHSWYSLWHSPSKALQHRSLVKSFSYFPVCHWTLFVHVTLLLLSFSINFLSLFWHHRVFSVTTARSLWYLHQINSFNFNRQNVRHCMIVSLKPISLFCAWKHMFQTLEDFSACKVANCMDIVLHMPNFQHSWNSKYVQEKMMFKNLKLWIWNVISEVCLIPKFQNFSPPIF